MKSTSRCVVEYQELLVTPIEGLEELDDPEGYSAKSRPDPGTIAPGFVQRHVAHPSTTIEQSPGLALSLHFALVGTLSLAVGRSSRGVPIVPEIANIREFIDAVHC